MYKAVGVNEYGQLYSAKGILDQYKEDLESSVQEFDNLAEAIDYAREFITTYPQVRFEIYKARKLIEEIYDKEYWSWKNKNAEKLREVNSKGAKLQSILFNIFLGIVGLLLALVVHCANDTSLTLKLFFFPFVVIAGWHTINRLFAKIC